MFNLPRLALWPLQVDPDPTGVRTRNAKDRLIALCSTVGGRPFHFQRHSVYTQPLHQWRVGGGLLPSSQSPTLDWELPRNQELYRYLRALTDTPVPAWGQSFNKKWSSPEIYDQILVGLIDFLRMGLNTYAIDPDQPPNTTTLRRASSPISTAAPARCCRSCRRE